jgi:DUF438 domain-containing protein
MIENLSQEQLAGILEATQDITEIKKIEGEKRLLDY